MQAASHSSSLRLLRIHAAMAVIYCRMDRLEDAKAQLVAAQELLHTCESCPPPQHELCLSSEPCAAAPAQR